MRVEREESDFKPLTIVLESAEDIEKFTQVLTDFKRTTQSQRLFDFVTKVKDGVLEKSSR